MPSCVVKHLHLQTSRRFVSSSFWYTFHIYISDISLEWRWRYSDCPLSTPRWHQSSGWKWRSQTTIPKMTRHEASSFLWFWNQDLYHRFGNSNEKDIHKTWGTWREGFIPVYFFIAFCFLYKGIFSTFVIVAGIDWITTLLIVHVTFFTKDRDNDYKNHCRCD